MGAPPEIVLLDKGEGSKPGSAYDGGVRVRSGMWKRKEIGKTKLNVADNDNVPMYARDLRVAA